MPESMVHRSMNSPNRTRSPSAQPFLFAKGGAASGPATPRNEGAAHGPAVPIVQGRVVGVSDIVYPQEECPNPSDVPRINAPINTSRAVERYDVFGQGGAGGGGDPSDPGGDTVMTPTSSGPPDFEELILNQTVNMAVQRNTAVQSNTVAVGGNLTYATQVNNNPDAVQVVQAVEEVANSRAAMAAGAATAATQAQAQAEHATVMAAEHRKMDQERAAYQQQLNGIKAQYEKAIAEGRREVDQMRAEHDKK